MISFYNSSGKIYISERYFVQLIHNATKTSVGVAGMVQHDAAENIKAFLNPAFSKTGVQVTEEDGKLFIDLHIKVVYGVNITQTVKSIIQNVNYNVEKATGFAVGRVNVFVDGVVS